MGKNYPVLDWPAVPTPSPEEVYKGESDKAKEYALWLEENLRQSKNFEKPEALNDIYVNSSAAQEVPLSTLVDSNIAAAPIVICDRSETRFAEYAEVSIQVPSSSPEVAWSWLVEALESRGDQVTALGGTVTATTSVRYGDISGPPRAHQLEMRASWTATDLALGTHVQAFCEVLEHAAGLPPAQPRLVRPYVPQTS